MAVVIRNSVVRNMLAQVEYGPAQLFTFTASGTLSIPTSLVSYLVVAGGGGGGGRQGAGGAGGYRAGSGLFLSGGTYTITVGAGGGVPGELEEIDTIEMDRDELLSTRFKDAKTIIAVNWARYNHNVK